MSADALIFAYPTPSVASRHLPLTGGVGPGPLFTGDALLFHVAGFPARKIRSAYLRFHPAPLGA